MCLLNTLIKDFVRDVTETPSNSILTDFVLRLEEWIASECNTSKKPPVIQAANLVIKEAALCGNTCQENSSLLTTEEPGVALVDYVGAATALICSVAVDIDLIDRCLIYGGCRNDCGIFVKHLKTLVEVCEMGQDENAACQMPIKELECLPLLNFSDTPIFSEPWWPKKAEVLELNAETHSVSDFLSFVAAGTPVIIRNYAKNWLSVGNDLVAEILYRHKKRLVPVEVGAYYTRRQWNIEIMPISRVLRALSSANTEEDLYLAQYPLIYHLPELGDVCPSPSLLTHLEDFRNGRTQDISECLLKDDPTANALRSGLLPIRNCWLGPSGKITPYHQDSYENLYVQVCGQKYFQLLKASLSPLLRPFKQLMNNTSQIPPQHFLWPAPTNDGKWPELLTLQNEARHAWLREGDCLYVPKHMWHLVQGVTTNFGISNWIN
eukprot:Gregarina_sp_Poly_1__637@NODE_114_length_13862_cov_162_782240_g101_i0_p4_GENE_NODE_114_length_13862_cov_162_782240_g101_i0NODE_114_length_13862_cov_162_782240_g101_i0_p4_ORF_typecomplete_len436_score52_02Cupin_8/PF13621_6/1_9e35Cupin_4/PF08007_12/2_2e09_NODE_114_length_13862_cov_162_782240_g101_i040845391